MEIRKNIAALTIVLEIILGFTLGFVYLSRTESNWSSLENSVFTLYLVLNAIFFGSTLVPGVTCAIILQKTNRLIISILLSLAAGIAFLVFHAMVLPVPLFAFFSLSRYIIGFNAYLLKKQD